MQTLRVDADWQRQWGDTDVCMGIWGRDRVSNMKREPVPHWRSRSVAGGPPARSVVAGTPE